MASSPHIKDSQPLANGKTASLPNQYPYPVLPSNRHLRLFRLFPRTYEPIIAGEAICLGQLHGELIEYDLDNEQHYGCLSYTWGTTQEEHPLWIDTYAIAISTNLNRALRSLQLKDHIRVLWVDFICIDQASLLERRKQVQIMQNIYANAVKVIVYLGDEADGSENLPKLFQQLHDASFRGIDTDGLDDTGLTLPWTEADCIKFGLPSHEDKIWASFRAFLPRPWFVRVWIIQEALAARDLKIICGKWLMKGDFIFHMIQFAMQRDLPITERLKDMPEAPAAQAARHIFLCLISGSERLHMPLQPDYTKSTAEIYLLVARYMIEAGFGPELLCNASLSNTTLSLPSWVPDWSLRNLPIQKVVEDPRSPLGSCAQSFIAAGGDQSTMRLSNSTNELVVHAYLIDTVAILGRVYKHQNDPPGPRLDDFDDDERMQNLGNEATMRSSQSPSTPTTHPTIVFQPCPELFPKADGPLMQRILERCLSHQPTQWPVLWTLTDELSHFVRISSIYESWHIKEICNIIWRSLICSRTLTTMSEAPDYYFDLFWAYIKDTQWTYDLHARLSASESILSEYEEAGGVEDLLSTLKGRMLICTFAMNAKRRDAKLFSKLAKKFSSSYGLRERHKTGLGCCRRRRSEEMWLL
ncbi:hypothetical protein MMC18_004000 [Xylographa bjoerkii]|nr:hypothetical protein [Xylographa bjoerkii]